MTTATSKMLKTGGWGNRKCIYGSCVSQILRAQVALRVVVVRAKEEILGLTSEKRSPGDKELWWGNEVQLQ